MNTKKWLCKDGRKVRIKDMTDTHLANTIKFLEKAHLAILDTPPPDFQGEMAQMYADQEYNALMDSTVEDYFPIVRDMKEDFEKRRNEARKK